MTAIIHSAENRQRELLATHSRTLYERGLASGSSGNVSVRLDDGWLMTPTNSCLGDLDPAKISKLSWQGEHLAGDAPSKEAFLHSALYETRPQAGAIVHTHSTYTTAVSCLAGLNPQDCLPALTPYFVMKIGRLALIPYHRPGDQALGSAVRALNGQYSAVLLANHGPVVSAKNLEAAVYASEELEETAKIFLLLRNAPTCCLNEAQLAELKTVFKLDF